MDYVEKVAYENDVEEMEVLADMEQRRRINYNENDSKISKFIKRKVYGEKNLADYTAAYDRLRRAKDSIYANPGDPRNVDELTAARKNEEDIGTIIDRRTGRALTGLAALSALGTGIGTGIGVYKMDKDFKKFSDKVDADFEAVKAQHRNKF